MYNIYNIKIWLIGKMDRILFIKICLMRDVSVCFVCFVFNTKDYTSAVISQKAYITYLTKYICMVWVIGYVLV